MRDQRGQTAAEYLGMIVLVAVVVLALATSDAGARLSDGVQDAICRIAGGDCEREPGAEAPADDVADATGPAFGDGGFPVSGVPWDGSVTFKRETPNDQGLYVEGSITEKRAACTLGADGKPIVDLSVQGQFKTGLKGEKEGAGFGGGVQAYVGRQIAWDVRTSPENADGLQDGSIPAPNPIDPTSIPEGTILTLSESTFDGLGLDASYRGIQTSFGYDAGTKVSSAIQRVDEGTVRVTVGDSEFVNQTADLTLGGLATAGVSRGFDSGRAKRVELDLSTKAGRDAYGAFVKSGELPAEGPGVGGTTDLRSSTSTDTLKLGLKLPGGLGGSLDSNQIYHLVEETTPDGRTMITAWDGGQQITTAARYELFEDGTTGPAETTIRWADSDQDFAERIAQVAGGDPDAVPEGEQDVALTLSDEQLEGISDAAADAYYQMLLDRGTDMSRDEFDEQLASDEPEFDEGQPFFDDDYLIGVAQANPAEVVEIIKAESWGIDPEIGLAMIASGAGKYRLGDDLSWDNVGDVLGLDPPVSTPPGC